MAGPPDAATCGSEGLGANFPAGCFGLAFVVTDVKSEEVFPTDFDKEEADGLGDTLESSGLTLLGEVADFNGADFSGVVLFSPNEVVELLATTVFGLLRTLVATGLMVVVADF